MAQVTLARREFLTAASAMLPTWMAPIARPRPSARVLVIGAGLAGLNAALNLESAGAKVTVLEASKRVGGRLHTLHDKAGRPEVGAIEVGKGYQRLIHIANRFDVALEEPARGSQGLAIAIGNQMVPLDEWSTSKANRLSANLRSVPPYLLESTLLRNANPLTKSSDWCDPSFQKHDVSYEQTLKRAGADSEALRLIAHQMNARSLAALSSLDIWRRRLARSQGPRGTLRIRGGSSRLPEAMAANLTDVRLNQPVIEIITTDRHVQCTLASGQRLKADFAVLGAPLAALKQQVHFQGLLPVHQQALHNQAYAAVTQIHLLPKAPFWEEDGLPPTMWTDSPLERIFAISGPDGQPQRFKVWVNGPGARHLDAMSPKTIAAFVLDTLAKIRPASKGKLTVDTIHSWGQAPFTKGAYAYFSPGQIGSWMPHWQKPSGRLFFAGSHTASEALGMEGALESGERVAHAIQGF